MQKEQSRGEQRKAQQSKARQSKAKQSRAKLCNSHNTRTMVGMGEGDPHTFINRRATIVDTYRLSPRYHQYSMSLPSFKTNKRHIGYRTFHTCTKVHPPFPVDVRGANEIINISKSDRFFFAVYDWHWTSKTGGIAVQCKTCTFVEVHESFLVYYSVYLK